MLVLFRELRRQSRRLGWWTSRTMIAGLIFVTLAIVLELTFSASTDPNARIAAFQTLGTVTLSVVHAVVVLIMAIVTPQIAAGAIQAERDDRTLDLLAMTGLRPATVLLSTLGSRLVVVVSLLAGLLPAFALLPWLGGVGPVDILLSSARALMAGLVLGGVALPIALATRGSTLPLIGVLTWFIVFGTLFPARMVFLIEDIGTTYAIGNDRLACLYLPLLELAVQDVDRVVPVVGWWVLPAIGGIAASIWRFRREAGAHRPTGRAFPLPWLFWVELLFVLTVWGVAEWTPRASNETGDVLLWVGLLACVAASDAALRATCWLLPRLGNFSLEIDRTSAIVEPISWRELFTRAHGPLGLVMVLITAGYVLIGFIITILSSTNIEPVAVWGVIGATVTLLLSGVLVTATFAEEVRARTWDTLRTTTLYPGHLVLAKIGSVAVLVGPLLIFAFLFAIAPDPRAAFGRPDLAEAWWAPTRGLFRLISAASTLAWIAGAWTCLAAGTAALILMFRKASVMWGLGTVGAVLAPTLVLIAFVAAAAYSDQSPVLAVVASLLVPPFAPHSRPIATPVILQVFAVSVWWFLAASLFGAASWFAARTPR